MEEKQSGTIYSAAALTSVACLSALLLSIQRRFYHNTNCTQFGKNPSPLKFDTVRDYSIPFADNTRLNRIFFDSLLMTAMTIYKFFTIITQYSKQIDESTDVVQLVIYEIASNSLICISWIYILALTVVSRRYKLPSKWGFILNIHLFIYYMTSLFVSLYCLWNAFRVHHSQLSLSEGLPLILTVVFSFDLFYTTGSIEQGPPYMDTHGKLDKPEPVAGITVASIFSILYFNWCTPLIFTIYKNAQNVRLPNLPPNFRGYNLFYIFSEKRDQPLLYRLVSANSTTIVIQSIATVIIAVLYYAPAYFLNKFLTLISIIDTGKQDEFYMAEGIIIIFGLALSAMVLNVAIGQQYFMSSSMLRVRIKAMLNIELYRKTLRRMGTIDINRDIKEREVTGIETGNKINSIDPANTNKENQVNTVGNIVNLMSTDSQRIADFTTSWFTIIEAPIELIVGISFLYSLLGKSCLFGLSVMIITLPMNHYNSVIFAKTQEKLMKSRDKRVSLMNEVLQGIRQIKFFAWESNWEKRILESRNTEIQHLRTTFLSEVLFNFLWQGTPLLVTIVSFFSFTKIQGQTLTAPIAFTAITVFTELRSALNTLPETFVDALQALVSIRRIESYLNEQEVLPPENNLDHNLPIHIGFKNATVSWVGGSISSDKDDDQITAVDSPLDDSTLLQPTSSLNSDTSTSSLTYKELDSFILQNLSCHFPNNLFSIICGATGSGKTLFMLSLLGETFLLDGECFCPRESVTDNLDTEFNISADIQEEDWILDNAVAYVSQTAWLRNATIRKNILFGLPYIEKRYKETLYACALHKDLSYLEDGDETEIGEKGITLSGGQRARVALARAVYSRAKNILLDDVLSAVDAHTARHLYEVCLTGPLMEGRTRILITHHLALCMPGASYVVHLKNGRINFCGPPEELETVGKLELILDDTFTSIVPVETVEEVEEITSNPSDVILAHDLNLKTDDKAPKVLIQEEKRALGNIKYLLYRLYFKSLGGYKYWIILFIFIFGARSLDVAESWWIKKWVHANESNSINTTVTLIKKIRHLFEQPLNEQLTLLDKDMNRVKTSSGLGLLFTSIGNEDHLNMYLFTYILITVTNMVVGAGRFAVLYYGSLKASKKLHQELLRRILRAPMRFFDTTPVGRILNRFSKDFESIDSGVPNALMYFLIQWLAIISSILTVCTVLPVFVIPMTLVTVLSINIGKKFSAASRELRRMDSVSRSPLFTHFGETIVGVATIRAYGATKHFMVEMLKRVDDNSRPYYYAWIANRWVGVRFSFLGATINLFTGIFILLSLNYMDASLAGFCLSFVMTYTSQMTMAIKRFTRLEVSFNAIERIVEFMEIEQEPPAITTLRPPHEWPTEGKIQVTNLQVRYAPELDAVLKSVTFTVKAREKIGIVGRTGSGKSTLALSFFRFIESTAGSIFIDDIDICQIGTDDLRSRMTIIPQDPVLFSGNLRSNLDPFDEFDDGSILTALQRVKLIPSDEESAAKERNDGSHCYEDLKSNLFTDLDTPVVEGGYNFSQGQRQLVCLARALLKKSRIVFMDEATASVDFETDEAIQKTIASEFSECTILCIAHRLRTVIEYDRILVLEQGRIVEFENPLELLNRPNSVFNKMCENSGEYDTLVALAKEKHQLINVM